jgi:hypothetical protein
MVLDAIGYAFLLASALGILYVFYRILSGFFKAFMKHDD